MKILVVSSFLVFEETRLGGSKRIFNIARSLGQDHEVQVICFDGSDERARWDGRHPFRKFLLLPPRRPRRLPQKWRHGLDATESLEENRGPLERFLAGEEYDCVILAYMLAPNLLQLPQIAAGRRIVYIEGDLAIGKADASRQQASGFLAKALKEIRYRQIRRYYADFLGKVHTFFISTRTEIQEINRRFPGVRTAQLPIGMDIAGMRLLPSPEGRAVAGFLGHFGHSPNRDAVLWYLENVHPVLSSRHAEYRFVVAGMDPPPDIAARAETDPKLICLGAVDDLESFYRRISFFVNPIVSGKGIRTKVIEATAYGRAVVSTPLGADGTEPLGVFLGDGKQEFILACSRMIDGPPGLEKAVARNRQIAEERFSNEAVRGSLLGQSTFLLHSGSPERIFS